MIFALAALVAWRKLNVLPTGHDSLTHLVSTLQMAFSFKEDSSIIFSHIFSNVPARYMPATYLLGAVTLLAFDFDLWGCTITIAVFWFFGLVGLYYLGRRLFTRNKFVSFLLPAAFLTIPAFWEIGFSYNLESGLFAGVVLIVVAMLYADKINSWLMVPVCIIVAFLALTKAVLLIHIIPVSLVLLITAKGDIRIKRLVIFGTVILSSSYWLLTRYDKIGVELGVDILGTTANQNPLIYYVDLILHHFYSPILLLGIFLFFIFRIRKKDFSGNEIFLVLLLAVPFIFYTFVISTKHPWYLLQGYIAIPALFLVGADRLWDKRFFKILIILICVLYAFLSARVIAHVAAISVPGGKIHKRIEGIRVTAPPSVLEKVAVDLIVREIQNEPKLRVAVDLSGTRLSAKRFKLLTLQLEPRVLFESQILVTDEIMDNLRIFIETLPKMTRVYTIGKQWPNIDPGLYSDDPNIAYIKVLAKNLADKQSQFRFLEQASLPRGQILTVFENINPEQTFAKDGLILFEKLSNQVLERKAAEDWEGALEKIMELRKIAHPSYLAGINMELALILEKLRRLQEAEKYLWQILEGKYSDSKQQGDAALILCRLAEQKGDPNLAIERFDLALQYQTTPGLLADTASILTQAVSKETASPKVQNLMQSALEKVTGPDKGQIRIAIGKLAMKAGDMELALDAFGKAKTEIDDLPTLDWLQGTIEEITSMK